ncbi:MAG: FecR family protein [Agriterribacter sp.]
MKHIPDHIQVLVQKYFDKTATDEEVETLNNWYQSFNDEEVVVHTKESEHTIFARLKGRLQKLLQKRNSIFTLSRHSFIRIAAIFLCLILIASLFYLIYSGGSTALPQQNAITVTSVDEIKPGGNKAVLTLADGTTVVLDSSANGTLGTQGNTNIIKLGNGELRYKNGSALPGASATLYNTIATPRGGQYAIELADQTKVWLNSSSSIRFPTDFRDSVREVEITGEAYFEVAHHPTKPFKVKVNDAYIRVLGTHFNVMAYSNEATINTTLLQGSLIAGNNKTSRLLTRGNQARISKNGAIEFVKDADTEEAVAWRSGRFLFNSSDMYSMMRQVERWYNIDVDFKGDIGLHFSGQLNRYANVSELLRKLELTNEVHFEIENGKITVIPGPRERE